MKAYYIKIKDLGFEVPEIIDNMRDIVIDYISEDGFLSDDCYAVANAVEGQYEEIFIFFDAITIDKLLSFLKEYNLLIDSEDITQQVKFGSYKNDIFESVFQHEIEKVGLLKFIYDNTSVDDILEKISISGYDSLSVFEKSLLK